MGAGRYGRITVTDVNLLFTPSRIYRENNLTGRGYIYRSRALNRDSRAFTRKLRRRATYLILLPLTPHIDLAAHSSRWHVFRTL